MSAQYRQRTLMFLSQMKQQNFEEYQRMLNNTHIADVKEARVIFSRDDNSILGVELPSNRDHANDIFLKPLTDNLKRGELASIYNVSPSQFSMIISRTSVHRVSRDLILCAALMTRTPISVEAVDHTLMELGLPGLFTGTYNERENKRNFILCRILEYGQTHTCADSWLTFARGILNYLDMDIPGGNYRNISIPSLSPEEIELAEQWQTEAEESAEKLTEIDYMPLRNHYFNLYVQKTGLTRAGALRHLSEITFLSEDAIKKYLTAKVATSQTHGSRESLIRLAAELGCTLDEANILLRQSNMAIIYPLQENAYEMELTQRLLRNGEDVSAKT